MIDAVKFKERLKNIGVYLSVAAIVLFVVVVLAGLSWGFYFAPQSEINNEREFVETATQKSITAEQTYYEKHSRYTSNQTDLQTMDPTLGDIFIDDKIEIEALSTSSNGQGVVLSYSKKYFPVLSNTTEQKKAEAVSYLFGGETVWSSCRHMGDHCNLHNSERTLVGLAGTAAAVQMVEFVNSGNLLNRKQLSEVPALNPYFLKIAGYDYSTDYGANDSVVMEFVKKDTPNEYYNENRLPYREAAWLRVLVEAGELKSVNCEAYSPCPSKEELLEAKNLVGVDLVSEGKISPESSLSEVR